MKMMTTMVNIRQNLRRRMDAIAPARTVGGREVVKMKPAP